MLKGIAVVMDITVVIDTIVVMDTTEIMDTAVVIAATLAEVVVPSPFAEVVRSTENFTVWFTINK